MRHRRAGRGVRHVFPRNVHVHSNAERGIRGSLEAAGDRCGVLRIARDGDGDVLRAGHHAAGRVKALPTRAGQIDFRPGMGRRTTGLGRFALHVAAGEARGQSPRTAGLQQERGEVAARPAAFFQRLRRGLHARLITALVLEGFKNMPVDVLQQEKRFNVVARFPELRLPLAQGVMSRGYITAM